MGKRCDFVCCVVMRSTTDFSVIPDVFLALLLLHNCFHVPASKQFVEYKEVRFEKRQIKLIWVLQRFKIFLESKKIQDCFFFL